MKQEIFVFLVRNNFFPWNSAIDASFFSLSLFLVVESYALTLAGASKFCSATDVVLKLPGWVNKALLEYFW